MKEKNNQVVVETQVLGGKPPQICKKNQNTQKFGKKEKKARKNVKVSWCKKIKTKNETMCINAGNNMLNNIMIIMLNTNV